MKTFLKSNIRGIFYGFFVSIGLIFLIELLSSTDLNYFLIASGVLYLIFVFEIFSNLLYSKQILAQMEIPQVDTYSKASQITHHILLPTILYLSCLGIIYFYHLTLPKVFFFFLLFFTFSLLFINIRAYYEDKFKLEERTHYVYDFIKFITFFQLTNSVLEIQLSLGLKSELAALTVGAIAFVISFFVIIRRRQLGFATILFNIFTSLIIGAVLLLLLTYTGFSILAVSLYTLLVFYITSAILHHKLEGSLNKEIFLEYVAVLLLTLAILQGLNS